MTTPTEKWENRIHQLSGTPINSSSPVITAVNAIDILKEVLSYQRTEIIQMIKGNMFVDQKTRFTVGGSTPREAYNLACEDIINSITNL